MSTICTQSLSGNILNDCSEVYGKGLTENAWIIDRNYIDSITQTDNIISAIALKSGKQAYKAYQPSKSPMSGFKVEDQNAEIGMQFNKTVPIVLLANSPANAKHVRELKSSSYVVVVKLKNTDETASQAFLVIGAEQGATCQNATNEINSDTSLGGWAVDMIEEAAKTPQIFFFSTDIEVSEAALDALCAAGA